MQYAYFFFYVSADPQDVHVLNHSSPTRRPAVLAVEQVADALAVRSADDHIRLGGDDAHLRLDRRPRRIGLGEPAGIDRHRTRSDRRSEEHTSELQSLMRTSYAVFCLKKKKTINYNTIV